MVTKFFVKTVLIAAVTASLRGEDLINYPPSVGAYDLVQIKAIPPEGDVNYLVMSPIELKNYKYENNRYLVFVAPPSGDVVIIFQYVNWDTKQSVLERILIKVTPPVPPTPVPPTPVPPVPPTPSGLDSLIREWFSKVPNPDKSILLKIGQNYLDAAISISATSENPRDDMVGRVKVLNLQTLKSSTPWSEPFFLPLAKWMDSKSLNQRDYEGHFKLFSEVGEAIKRVARE